MDDHVHSDDERPARRPRAFPWRLWLYAIVMTGAAAAGGYFFWKYRSETRTDLDEAAQRSAELERQNETILKNLSASKDELDALRKQKEDADKRMLAIEEIRKKFAKLIDTGQLKVIARRGQLVLSLPSEVLFPTGSAELSKQGEYAVVGVANILKAFPDRRFLVVGHTDNDDFAKPAGNKVICVPTDNWQLSTARALTVSRILVLAGMKAENVIPAGVGENDPIASNASPDGRQRNRRIEIALLPAINELPPLPSSLTEKKE